MKKKTLCLLTLCALLLLTACARQDAVPAATQAPSAAHEPITMMSGGKDYSDFIAYVKSIYPEINIEIVPYRGANTTQYMYDQLYTGYMPDIYGTTQLFTCYDKYEEHLIDLSRYDFTGNYNEARISQYEVDG